MADIAQLAADALSTGNGILRLAPTWVPRSFPQPGRRLKLHPNDYYAMGMHRGNIEEMTLQTPVMIRFGDMTDDEVFVVESKAKEGVTFENTGQDPLVGLRYFGPDAQPNAPANGAWKG